MSIVVTMTGSVRRDSKRLCEEIFFIPERSAEMLTYVNLHHGREMSVVLSTPTPKPGSGTNNQGRM